MKYRILLFLLSCFFVNDLASQNLITNGDFESGGNGVGFNINGVGYTLAPTPYSGTTVPGNYAFATNPQTVNANFLPGTDHTSGTGNMMIVDGNTEAGIQYLYRLGTDDTGLCGLTIGQYYTFSYWVKTISSEVTDVNTRPSLKLLATGVEDFTFVSGSSLAPLPAEGWQQRTYTFKAVDACVTIEMWNVNYSALGNDFALDDFSLNPLPSATISPSETYCMGSAVNVTFTATNGVAPYTFTYTINGGANQTISSGTGNTAVLPVSSTSETVIDYKLVSVSYGAAPVYSNAVIDQSAKITIRDLTAAIFGDITTCPGYNPVITFTGSVGATVHFTSDSGDVGEAIIEANGEGSWSPTAPVSLTTTYMLDSISDGACSKPLTGSVTVTINDVLGCGFDVPNQNIAYASVQRPTPICEGYSTQTTLIANYPKLKGTTDYISELLPFNGFLDFLGGAILVVDADDKWSDVQNLPFVFSFYNKPYQKLLVGANGLLSFNLSPANVGGGIVGGTEMAFGTATGNGANGCAYLIQGALNATVNNTAIFEKNAIFGVWQDIDPKPATILNAATQNINYYISGEAPNRRFVLNTTDIPLWSNGTGGTPGLQTYQIVIYETTNYIDVNVKRRRAATQWGGEGVIGIINQDGSKALPGVGRNTGNWSILTPETYRFRPNGAFLKVKVEWFEGNSTTPFSTEIITDGSAPTPLPVTPQRQNTFYRLVLTYTNPDNTEVKLYDNVTVERVPELDLLDPLDKTICVNAIQPNYTFNIDQDLHILNGANALDYPISYHLTAADANDDADNIPAASLANYQVPAGDLPKTIYTRLVDMTGTDCVNIRPFVLTAKVAAGTFVYPNTTSLPYFCNSTAVALLPQTTGLTAGGKYSADEPGLSLDSDTGAIDLQNSIPGFYEVTYKISDIGCSYSTTSGVIEIKPCCTVTSDPDFSICSNVPVTLTATGTDPATIYTWTGPGLAANTTGKTITFTPPLIAGEYVYTVAGTVSGQPCDVDGITKIKVIDMPTVAFSYAQTPTLCTGSVMPVGFSGSPNAFVKYDYDVEGITGQTTIQLDAAGNYSFNTPALTMYAKYQLVDVTSNVSSACVTTFTNNFREFNVGQPSASITTAGSPVTVCSGFGTGFTILGTPGSSVDISLSNAAGTQVLPPVLLDATTGEFNFQTGNLSVEGGNTFTLTQVTSNGTCSATISGQSFTVNVKASPVINTFTATSTFVCAGASATYNVNGTANATISYNDGISTKQLLLDASGNGTFTVSSATLTSPIVVKIFDITTSGPPYCITTFGTPLEVSVTINALPLIVTDPVDKVLCPGTTSVSFSVAASGTDIQYEWYKVGNATALANDGHYFGTGTNTLTIDSPASPADIGFYYARVLNASCGFDDSAQAELSIDAVTVINTQPVGVTVCEGTPDTRLRVDAVGVPNLVYQWYYGTSATSLAPLPAVGGNFSGTNTKELIITGAVPANAGFYQCWISTSCPGVTKTDIVQVQVTELPKVVSQSSDVIQCSNIGTPISLTVQTNVPVPTYRWYRNGTALSDVLGKIAGSATATLTIDTPGITDTGDYTCVVTNSCGSDTSGITKVTIPAAPSITSGPAPFPAEALPLARCEGQFFELRVNVPAGFAVKWQLGGVDLIDGMRISGSGTPSLKVTSVQLSDAGDYTAIVTGDAACAPLTSGVAKVIINAVPVITQQPQSAIICEASSRALSVSVQDPTGLSFQWQFNGVDITASDAAALNLSGYNTNELIINSATAANDGNYVCVISSGCPNLPSQQARVVVVPLPQATISNGVDSVVCSGNSSDILFTGTPSAIVTYTVNGGAAQTITLNPSGTAVLITGVLTQTTTYQLVSVQRNDTPSCPATVTGSATVTVNAFPVVALDQDGYICLDLTTNATTSYLLDTGLSATDYDFEWYHNNTLLATETGPSIQADQGGTYRVVVTDVVTLCTGFATAPIEVSSPPVTITAEANTTFFADSGTITVTVTPAGDYEYRLDNGPYQSDNVFNNVRSLTATTLGMHTVYARDLKACGELEFDVRIIDYPKYFTPNGDGYHDTWNISSLSEQSNAKIYIFDRFGKLVKQISTTGAGWDGTLNGKPLVADDYWFVIKYSEQGINKEFRSHFALKR